MTRFLATLALTVYAIAWCAHSPALGQSAQLIPEPFLIEHYIVHDDGRNQVLRTDNVTDYYGGSWIVSVRPDDSRMIIDLERGELTEIDAAKGSYWTVSFERFADLHARLMALENDGVDRTESGALLSPSAESKAVADGDLPALEVVEVSASSPAALRFGSDNGSREPAHLTAKAGVRRLQVRTGSGASRRAVEIWVDPSVRLPRRALEALDRFEEVVGGGRYARERGIVTPGLYVSAARKFADGAVPVRTLRPIDMATAEGRLEDVSVRIEKLTSMPRGLVAIPEGVVRVPHPWEVAVAATEVEERIEKGQRP